MGVTLVSTTSTPEEQKAALESHGFEADSVNSYSEEEQVAETEKTAEAEAEASNETEAPEPEAGGEQAEDEPAKPDAKGKTAEGQELSEEEQEEQEKAILEGKEPEQFEGQKRLLKRIDKLHGRWKTEQGNRAKLEEQISELREQLEAKKEPAQGTAEPEPEPEPEAKKPERPKRPKKADFNFDDDTYEAALDKFENEDLPKYEDELAQWTGDQAAAKIRQEQAEEAAQQAAAERRGRYEESLKQYPDLQETIESHEGGVEMSAAMQAAMTHLFEPEDAAALVNYLAHHPEESAEIAKATLASSDNPGAEEAQLILSRANQRLARILGKLEATASAKPESAKPAEPAKAAPPKPKVTAAAPPPTPVSARNAPSATRTIKDIKTSDPNALKEYERLRKASRAS